MQRVRLSAADLGYVGSRVGAFHGKWTRVWGTRPKSLAINRFLASAGGNLQFAEVNRHPWLLGDDRTANLDGEMRRELMTRRAAVQQGDNVGRHVDADLSLLHGQQTKSFAKHAFDPVSRCCRVERHGDGGGAGGVGCGGGT